MTKVVGVRFKKVGRMYYFDPGELELESGVAVIVETAKGLEFGECVTGLREIEDERVVPPLRTVLRVATEKDFATLEQYAEKEKRALEICTERIAVHKIDMRPVSAEYTFDGNKILFYFTADGRVDFRELVKDLAGVFRTRIELRQIGVRDKAKMLGGLGICGKQFCCSTFLDDFQAVSIKMAKDQGLSLNPTKISGSCGRLLCCLTFEEEAYEELNRTTPCVDSVVKTPQGTGTVCDVQLLRGILKVKLDDSTDNTPKCFDKKECKLIGRPCRGHAPEREDYEE